MLELTKEQIQQLVDIIENKQNCHCSVSTSMRTVWITSNGQQPRLNRLAGYRRGLRGNP